METTNQKASERELTREEIISKKINSVGWALFFVMIGCLWLVPEETLPESTWLLGAGIIMLGSNFIRSIYGIKMVVFTNIIGIIALLTGITSIVGVELPVFPIMFILIGLSIIFGHLTEKNHPKE